MTFAQTESKQRYLNFKYLGQIEFVCKKSHVLCTWDHADWVFTKTEKNLMLVYL
jgi:hypothetical protein